MPISDRRSTTRLPGRARISRRRADSVHIVLGRTPAHRSFRRKQAYTVPRSHTSSTRTSRQRPSTPGGCSSCCKGLGNHHLEPLPGNSNFGERPPSASVHRSSTRRPRATRDTSVTGALAASGLKRSAAVPREHVSDPPGIPSELRSTNRKVARRALVVLGGLSVIRVFGGVTSRGGGGGRLRAEAEGAALATRPVAARRHRRRSARADEDRAHRPS